MDSLTQAALGAAVAEAGLGRKLGNRAVLWGVALGTLPDLDIIFYPWLDPIQRLEWHRGLSHSLLAMTLAAPLLGWLIAKIHRNAITTWQATVVVWWILFTHVLIDVFTVYGTMVFEPFSDHRLGFDNLFIIDPLFTLPLLIGVVAAMWLPKISYRRFWFNTAGLILSSVYALWSLGAQAVATDNIMAALQREKITPLRVQVSPTPFNTLLWRGLVETDSGLSVGYFSLLRPKDPVEFAWLAKPGKDHAPQSREFERLAWFAEGFYSLEKTDSGWIFRDWRFGELRQPDGSFESVFSWNVTPLQDNTGYSLARRRAPFTTEAVNDLQKNLLGME